MKVLIVYRSKYGTTESCAQALSGRIKAETTLADLRKGDVPDVHRFDVVLVGGSIYGGRIQREVTSFCEGRGDLLLKRRVGLFLCCLSQGEHAKVQLQTAFPESLAAHAFARSLFGGEVLYDKLTFLDRLLVRGLPRPPRGVSLVDTGAIATMADVVNSLPAGS
ncbi:MAG TPA: flavodoxin domain-containing protein [Spirochaetia bacterium]|nr:flavodoxin domain-containing protein [Spirochaetia bacterium]